MKEIDIIPTNTCPPDFAALTARSEMFAAFAPHVQLDVSDGKFSPVTSWPYGKDQWVELATMVADEKKLPCVESMLYECHLMVENPKDLEVLLIQAGAKRIIGHVEAFSDETDIYDTLDLWRTHGAEVGLAILYTTPFEVIDPAVDACDVVLMMTIPTIGKQGAPYMPDAPQRIGEFRARHPATVIAADGGVSVDNIAELAKAGVSRFGIGSAITKASDPRAAYEKLKNLAENAVK